MLETWTVFVSVVVWVVVWLPGTLSFFEQESRTSERSAVKRAIGRDACFRGLGKFTETSRFERQERGLEAPPLIVSLPRVEVKKARASADETGG